MVGANVDSLNLFEIRESLGMDPNQEDIYIIDNGVIVNTTYPPDLNLNFYDFGEDFKQYLENVQLADSFKSEKFSIEMSTKKLRKYTYQPTKDGRYIVQLGVYSVRANEVISSTNEILLDISKENPAILDVDLFIGADPPFSFDSSAEMELDSALIDKVSKYQVIGKRYYDRRQGVKLRVRLHEARKHGTLQGGRNTHCFGSYSGQRICSPQSLEQCPYFLGYHHHCDCADLQKIKSDY